MRPSGCGIVGAVNAPISDATFNAMTDMLAHRGPDGRGVWTSPRGSVRLGHRRLAIVGVDQRGAQPMTRGPLTITCNGEVYNYAELRRTLEELGAVFSSDTDTEVILHAYARWGMECLKRLRGIFAFGLYDESQDTLILARDPVGVKPLVYCGVDSGGLVFASEPKALLASERVSRAANFDLIRADLTHGLLGPKHDTWLAGVHYVEPGHAMLIDCTSGAHRTVQYWSYPEGPLEGWNEASVVEAFRERLHEAVRLQLRSDVGVTSTCSGGVDSSAVTALMCRAQSSQVDAFTLEYDDDAQAASAAREDLRYARLMTEAYPSLKLHVVPISMRKLLVRERIDSIVRAFDGAVPFDIRVLSFLQLYEHIRERGHKVVLIGQGADELWLGYYADRVYTFFQYSPEQLSADALATQFFLRRVPMGGFSAWNPDFLSPSSVLATSRENLARNYQSVHTDDALTRISHFVVRTHLQSILQTEDRVAMLSGIETRVPWLDVPLVELSFRVPSYLKLGAPEPSQRVKWLTRQVARGLVPEPIVTRTKAPFPDPPPLYKPALRALLTEELTAVQRSPFMRQLFSSAFLANFAADEQRSERELFAVYVLWRFAELYRL